MSSIVPPASRSDRAAPAPASVPAVPVRRTEDSRAREEAPRSRRRVWALRAGEVLAGPVAAALLLLLCARIDVDPLDRVGQVSGLAAIGLRFSVLALVLVALVLVAMHWRGGQWFGAVSRLACAAAAGLATGFVGGGLLVALDGTSWPLFADRGDAGQLARWVDGLVAGQAMPSSYPPLAVHAMAWFAELTGSSAPYALRTMEIVGTAVFAPIVYLAWRVLLRPAWALAAAVVSSSVLLDPYKPYGPLVLAVLVPVLLVLFRAVRRAPELGWGGILRQGLALGLAIGVLFLTYSGWFVWSALGAVAAVLLVFPWRTGVLRGAALVGTTAVAFGVVAAPHLIGLLRASSTVKDTYFYFDVYVEPAYIAMWRGDLPGDVGAWPPPGELGGVGLFSVLLVIGLGVAVWLGRRRTVVIGLTMLLAGAWLMRFWFAQQMYRTQAVQLYPRTTQQILYCSILLVGCAVFFVGERLRVWAATAAPARPAVDRRNAVPATLVAVLAFALFSGSATANRFMPSEDSGSVGYLAYVAQLVRQPDGQCPDHSGAACADTSDELVQRARTGAG